MLALINLVYLLLPDNKLTAILIITLTKILPKGYNTQVII